MDLQKSQNQKPKLFGDVGSQAAKKKRFVKFHNNHQRDFEFKAKKQKINLSHK